MMKSAKISFPW